MQLQVTAQLLVGLMMTALVAEACAEECSAVKDPTKRLACYDAAGKGGARQQQSPDLPKIRAAVRAGLVDPESARFGKLTYVRPGLACVTVNARNRMGGYSGDQQVVVEKQGGVWVAGGASDITHAQCIEWSR